jgi:tetratricopeptide (TPR) repeat protein
MKTRLFIATWLLLSSVAFSEESYESRFDKLNQGNDNPKPAFALLSEWRKVHPDDPDAWIASANFYVKMSSRITESTKPAEGGDYVVSDTKTGKAVGSISFGTDSEMTGQAIDFLATASAKFPNRLDIWLGLATLNYRYGSFDDLYKTLQRMADYTKDHSNNLKWLKGGPLPAPPDQFVPEQIHDRATDYYQTGTQEGLERSRKIAEIAAKAYPHHDYAFNDIAAYYSALHDDAKAREWLEKANAIDPSDTLVLLNLGDACVKLKDKEAARKYYQRVIDLHASADDSKAASDALARLKN